MNCKNCGAHYKTFEYSCPYCGTSNAMGYLWQRERKKAVADFEQKKKNVVQSASLFYINNFINAFWILIVGVVLAFLIYCIVLGIVDEKTTVGIDTAKAQSILDSRQYDEYSKYMEDNLFNKMNDDYVMPEEYKPYVQAYDQIHIYKKFCEKIWAFDYYSKAGKDAEAHFAIGEAIMYYHGQYKKDGTKYKDDYESNSELMAYFVDYERASLISEFGMTQEDIELVEKNYGESRDLTLRIEENLFGRHLMEDTNE